MKYEDYPEREPKHLGHIGPLRSRSNSMLGSNYITGSGLDMRNPVTYRSIMDLHRADLYREDNWRAPFVDQYMMQNQRVK